MNHRPDELREKMLERILDAGHVIQFVPADPDSAMHGGQPYAYTAGRTLAGRPEFLVTGLNISLSEVVLNGLVKLDEIRHPSGARPPLDVMAGTHAVIPLGDLTPLEAREQTVRMLLIHADQSPLLGAMAVFGATAVQCLQALWPRDGDYPSVEIPWPDQPIHPYGRTPLAGPDPYV